MKKDRLISAEAISSEIIAAIQDISDSPDIHERGVVMSVADGIAWIWGLRGCGFHEVITVETKEGEIVEALALNIEEDRIGAVILGNDTSVHAGDTAAATGEIFSVPVGQGLLGRIIDPVGRPLDGLGPVASDESLPVERIAPGVISRRAVHEPLETGITAIDAMIPIGRGQRELIIGDRQTGKTAIAIDTILHQHRTKSGVVSIYVAIGQKASTVARIAERLKREGALASSIIIATSSSDPASLQYIAPYAGCAMGEYFRDNGKHALIIYDDLTRHAWAYRHVSLLLRRPPGREAYPGDIFYVHSRLLERAAKLSDELGGGSLTALPIIETQANDVSAYIPTNVISITDGQIYLESSLFYQGIRPAINAGLSVSRVGGAAQSREMKAVAKGLRLTLAQYRDLASFAQLATDLDADTKQKIERGRRLVELLKQDQYVPLPTAIQYALLLAGNEGLFDDIPLEKIAEAKAALVSEVGTEKVSIERLKEILHVWQTSTLSSVA